MVGQAAVARRLGDLARARTLLDTAGSQYRQLDFPVGPPTLLAGLAWWALAADRLGEAGVFAANAAEGAAASADPTCPAGGKTRGLSTPLTSWPYPVQPVRPARLFGLRPCSRLNSLIRWPTRDLGRGGAGRQRGSMRPAHREVAYHQTHW